MAHYAVRCSPRHDPCQQGTAVLPLHWALCTRRLLLMSWRKSRMHVIMRTDKTVLTHVAAPSRAAARGCTYPLTFLPCGQAGKRGAVSRYWKSFLHARPACLHSRAAGPGALQKLLGLWLIVAVLLLCACTASTVFSLSHLLLHMRASCEVSGMSCSCWPQGLQDPVDSP